MNMLTRFAIGAFLIAAPLGLTADEPKAMSRAEFDQMLQDISNWGRWGDDDELGTLNLITPDKRRDAAALVEDGVSVSMSLELNKIADLNNGEPFKHQKTVEEFGGHLGATDNYSVSYHGYAHSHMDGLQHIAHDGMAYNGVAYDSIAAADAVELGIQNVAINGVFTRGVLVDMPRHLGIDYLPAGTVITAADIEEWERESGVRISSGDVLLIRTGRWAQIAQEGQWNILEKATGSDASFAAWLKARDVAMIGSDGISDVLPSGVEGLAIPLHALVIVGLGMPILDNLDLEAVADAAAERNRVTFLFVGAPLRVPGGTGSPLNPLAVF